MSTTTITGTINGVNNAALASKWITFRLVQLGTDSGATATVAQSVDSVQTDANGDFSIGVWNNGDSGKTSVLEITIDGSKAESVIIPTATATIELWDLIENYQADGSTSEQVPVESALFVRKSNNLSDLGSATTARTNLGVAIGTNVQAHSAVLDATTASFTTADEIKLDGVEALADVTDATNIAASGGYVAGGTDVALTDGGTGASDATTARTNLGLVIGSNVQAHSAVLDATTASFTAADEIKLDGVEALADVTDSTGILAAGGYIAGTTVVPIADGGTGATTAAAARAALGVDTAISDANASGNQGKQVIRSVTFPTSSDFLSVADDATLDVGTGDFSLFFTARIDSDSGTESIIYKYNSGIGYKVQFESGALKLILSDTVVDTYTLATGMNDDKWHVYVITVDRSALATAYIDNVAQTGVDVTSSGLTLDNTGQVQIGVNASANPLANGAMASYVGLTKDLISAAEIEDSSFDTTRLKELSSLSLCVDVSNSVRDDIKDRSSNGHGVFVNGTITYNDDRSATRAASSVVISAMVNEAAGITKGDVVYISGATGGKPQVSLADNTSFVKADVIAIARDTQIDTEAVAVITSGLLEGIDTSGFLAGDILYLGTSGALTKIHPTGINAVQRVGHAVTISATAGSMIVEMDQLTVINDHNDTMRYQLVNQNAGAFASTTYTLVNDASHRSSISYLGSGWGAGNEILGIYNEGYGRTIFTVDGNNGFEWNTDVTDSHNFSSTTKMSLTAEGELTIDTLKVVSLPAYEDEAAAVVAGLATGQLYQTTGTGSGSLFSEAGVVMVKQ